MLKELLITSSALVFVAIRMKQRGGSSGGGGFPAR